MSLKDAGIESSWPADAAADNVTLLVENQRLRDTIAMLVEAMRMQEKRETGEFHISQPAAKAYWDAALTYADAALAKPRDGGG